MTQSIKEEAGGAGLEGGGGAGVLLPPMKPAGSDLRESFLAAVGNTITLTVKWIPAVKVRQLSWLENAVSTGIRG